MPTSKVGDFMRDELKYRQANLAMEGPQMEEWRRLAGLPIPTERAEAPDFGGPGLNEIAARQAAAHQRRWLGGNGASPEQLARQHEPHHDGAPMATEGPPRLAVGQRVEVRLPDWFPNGFPPMATGTVQEVHVSSMIAMVALDAPHSEAMQILAAKVDMLVPIAVPQPFQVGAPVRAVRDADRGTMAGCRGTVTRVREGDGIIRGAVWVRIEDAPLGGAGMASIGATVVFYPADLELVEARTAPRDKTASEECLEHLRVNSNKDAFRSPEGLRRDLVIGQIGHVCIAPDPGPQEAFAATLELAGGRLVEIPGPDPAAWELAEEKRWDAEEDVRALIRREGDVTLRYARPVEAPNWGGGVVLLEHEAALCWAKDMARVVNGVSPRGALLRSLRTYRRRSPVDPHADRAYPTLRAYLW
jgi:hypothetical protein